jgi:hypothetical protein
MKARVGSSGGRFRFIGLARCFAPRKQVSPKDRAPARSFELVPGLHLRPARIRASTGRSPSGNSCPRGPVPCARLSQVGHLSRAQIESPGCGGHRNLRLFAALNAPSAAAMARCHRHPSGRCRWQPRPVPGIASTRSTTTAVTSVGRAVVRPHRRRLKPGK